jgi:hypothetical protein
MVCEECGGTGEVFGVGCDDREWREVCPWCDGTGEEAPVPKRAGIVPRVTGGGGNPRLPPLRLAPVSARLAHLSGRMP